MSFSWFLYSFLNCSEIVEMKNNSLLIYTAWWRQFGFYFTLGSIFSHSRSHMVLCDEFIWEIWLISETWLDCLKLTYNTCNSTNKGSKNWSITFKGHKAVLLKAILAKTSNFWPIGPIELKFWHLVLKMIHFNISLRRSHGSSFRPLWWLLLVHRGPKSSKTDWAPYFGLF